MRDDYLFAVGVDLVSVFCCVLLLLRFANLRFSHPATPYIFFHLNTVTVRLLGIANGAATLFSGAGGAFAPVTPDEIVRASLFFDLALWIVTAVWSLGDSDFAEREPTGDEMLIDPRILRIFVPIVVALGAVGMRFVAPIPGISPYEGLNSSAWNSSSYLYILPTWFGLGLLAHIYCHGAGRVTGTLLAAYLVLVAIGGSFRFRTIVTCLMLVHIWVERRRRRWPSLHLFIGLAFLAVLFFPMKELGVKIHKGASLDDLGDTLSSSALEVLDGRAADQGFLDQCASVMTLADMKGEMHLGSGYLPLLTLAVPRTWWPDKPSLGDSGYVKFVSTRTRPMALCGMIGTYIGEAYVDFGLVGVLLAPFVLAFGLSWGARRGLRAPYYSLKRFSYAIVSVNLIQVFRDGFIAMFMFTFVNMMPLVILILAHHALRLLNRRRESPMAGTLVPVPPGSLPS